VARGDRDRAAGIDDARTHHPAVVDRIAQRERRTAAIAQVAHRGEARAQGLHAVPLRPQGIESRARAHRLDERGLAAGVGVEVHMAVDEAGQHEPVAEVDHARADGAGLTTV